MEIQAASNTRMLGIEARGWTEIASAVSGEDLASVALQRLRERIELYRRRGEKQGT